MKKDYGDIHEADPQPLDRARLLRIGTGLQGRDTFYKMLNNVPDEWSKRILIVLAQWVRYGAQSVDIPATYAAALMATDPGPVAKDMEMPWTAFEIILPPGLVKSSHGDVFSVMLSEVPEDHIVQLGGRISGAKYFAIYTDENSNATHTFGSLQDLANGAAFLGIQSSATDELLAKMDNDLEARVWSMLSRLLANTILHINTARADKPKAYPSLPPRTKRGVTRANTHRLGSPLKIDTRQWVREYIAGDRKNSPELTTWVRGHYREQAHGPKWSLHKRLWIEPHRRGDGPHIQRPIHIKEPE